MFNRARQMEQEGRRIIHLEIGRPDFDTPFHIVEAAVKALHEGKHHYCPNAGIFELRQAVAEKYLNEYSLSYDPETEILITNGVAEGIFLAVNALLNPGDQLLIPDPRWVNYEPDAFAALADPVSYSLSEKNGFQPDPEEIADKITPRTRMLVLASPSNPTGGVDHLCSGSAHLRRHTGGNAGAHPGSERLVQILFYDRLATGLRLRADITHRAHAAAASVHDHLDQHICSMGRDCRIARKSGPGFSYGGRV